MQWGIKSGSVLYDKELHIFERNLKYMGSSIETHGDIITDKTERIALEFPKSKWFPSPTYSIKGYKLSLHNTRLKIYIYIKRPFLQKITGFNFDIL